jgi:hypothetical protein
MPVELFSSEFLSAIESLVRQHHTIYPHLPPQGLFLEALVEQGFRLAGWSRDRVVASTPNSPMHDLLVGDIRLSVKSETGKVTRPGRISITKLCTTEKGEWAAPALVAHAIAHLQRYDKMLMLRAVWGDRAFRYQLLDIPLAILSRMREAGFKKVGTRSGRRSFGADVMDGKTRVFRVHFDGADGKCQIHDLLVGWCQMLHQWEQPIE